MSESTAITDELLASDPFTGYSYSYPHKTAYRQLDRPVSLGEVWCDEEQNSLFLYFHIPFCEFRCGFCNLFTLSQPARDLTKRYLGAVRQQAAAIRSELPNARYARVAIGGGTPTYLPPKDLGEVFSIFRDELNVDSMRIPVSCEASPATTDNETLAALRDNGVDRLSLGIQSFDEGDSQAMGRPQNRSQVEASLNRIRQFGFRTLNLDLIYGSEGQSQQSWLSSVEQAIQLQPEELYLYPLYVRQFTGLGRRSSSKAGCQPNDCRLKAYQLARDRLLAQGYVQSSLRMFHRAGVSVDAEPTYCCQRDGMIGLGAGARSYTTQLHYSGRYAVQQSAIQNIIEDYVSQSDEDWRTVSYGIWLDAEDQRRRNIILSLLQANGLSLPDYYQQFGSLPSDDIPQLQALVDLEWAKYDGDWLKLTPIGIERSDAIGPWLYSDRVRRRMNEYEWT